MCRHRGRPYRARGAHEARRAIIGACSPGDTMHSSPFPLQPLFSCRSFSPSLSQSLSLSAFPSPRRGNGGQTPKKLATVGRYARLKAGSFLSIIWCLVHGAGIHTTFHFEIRTEVNLAAGQVCISHSSFPTKPFHPLLVNAPSTHQRQQMCLV